MPTPATFFRGLRVRPTAVSPPGDPHLRVKARTSQKQRDGREHVPPASVRIRRRYVAAQGSTVERKSRLEARPHGGDRLSREEAATDGYPMAVRPARPENQRQERSSLARRQCTRPRSW